YSGDSPALDCFDFVVREQLPGNGLDGLLALTEDGRLLQALDDLDAMTPWLSVALTPAQWALRVASSAGDPPAPPALAAFEAALTEAAEFLDALRRIPLAEFWAAAEAVLRLSPMRVSDRRRNVAYVLSV